MSTFELEQLSVGNTVTANVFISKTDATRVVNSTFVAMGSNSTVTVYPWVGATSVNYGSFDTNSTTLDAGSIAFGNNKFVSILTYVLTSGTNSYSLSSSDGVNWTATSFSSPTYGSYGITYGNGKFVSVGLSIDTSSDNGATWTQRASFAIGLTVNSYYAVAYGNGYYVAVGGSSDGGKPAVQSSAILYSTDAITWKSVGYSDSRILPPGLKISTVSNAGTIYKGLAYGNGIFVPHYGGVVYANNVFVRLTTKWGVEYSYDGITWNQSQPTSNATLSDLQNNGGSFSGFSVLGGDTGYSLGLAYGNGVFVTTIDGSSGQSGSRVLTSTSATANSWLVTPEILQSDPSNTYISSVKGIAYGNNRFVVSGSTGQLQLNIVTSKNLNVNRPPLMMSNTFFRVTPSINTTSITLTDGLSFNTVNSTPYLTSVAANSTVLTTLTPTESVNTQIFTANGAWTMPRGGAISDGLVIVHLWGGGGQGNSTAGGGGGAFTFGIYRTQDLGGQNSTATIIIGPGGSNATSGDGGTSSFVPLSTGYPIYAYGGKSATGGAGGGGWLSTANSTYGGLPNPGLSGLTTGSSDLGGGGGGNTTGVNGGSSIYGGGGGAVGAGTGGSSIYGGGGGTLGTGGVGGGSSVYGGRGGNTTVAATAPAGGGGAGADGQRGEVRVYTILNKS